MNWKSTIKLRKILFGTLKLPVIKVTKTGSSTADYTLQQLKDKHPLIPLLLKHRELTKLQNTYTKKWIDKIHPLDNRIHPDILMVRTPTGRLAMKDPNPQQIPKKGDNAYRIRRGIIAEPGCLLVEGDFSQCDLRVLAHHSKDVELCKAFNEGIDVHTHTATLIFNRTADKIKEEERQLSKIINFGVVYGMKEKTLAIELNISEEEAKDFLRRYFYRYWGVRQWQKRVSLECEKNGYVETFLGFRRYLPEIHNRNFYKKAAAERMAWSCVCSGGTNHILEMAMIRLYRELPEDVKIIVPVHDALVFEIPEKRVTHSDITDHIKCCMENVAKLSVPIVCNIKVGLNLGDMEKP